MGDKLKKSERARLRLLRDWGKLLAKRQGRELWDSNKADGEVNLEVRRNEQSRGNGWRP